MEDSFRFSVDDEVVYTNPFGDKYIVNFRGYYGFGFAVIVGKSKDNIGQMSVPTSTLTKK